MPAKRPLIFAFVSTCRPGCAALKQRKCCGPGLRAKLGEMPRFESLLTEIQGRLEREEFDALLASGTVAELLELVARLRREGSALDALEASQQALRAIHRLAEARPWESLPALVRATEELGRCSRRAGRHEDAVRAFSQSLDSLRLLHDTRPEAGLELALAESLTELALAAAICGRLDPAHDHALESVAIARAQLPGGLPLLSGSLVLLADLARDLGREAEARDHVEEVLALLLRAVEESLPGASAAGRRLLQRLRRGEMLEDLPEDAQALARRLEAMLA